MNSRYAKLTELLAQRFDQRLELAQGRAGDPTWVVQKSDLIEICTALRDEREFHFDMLMDLCGVDYLSYGKSEWQTQSATESGFSRGVQRDVIVPEAATRFEPRRFAVVYQLLSTVNNQRMRLRVFTGENNPPLVPSVIDVWSSANWYEREAFDLFGILFEGHPDLRRILTDYGFIGHPFRKDFPLIGNVEVRYDEEQGRVIYQPVTIEPRVLVPKTIRDDNRYTDELKGLGEDG